MIDVAFEKESTFPPYLAELENRGAIRGITLGDPNAAFNHDVSTLENALASQEMEEWRGSTWVIRALTPRLEKVEKLRDALTRTTMQAAESGTELGQFTLLVEPEIPATYDGIPLFSTNVVQTIVDRAKGRIVSIPKQLEEDSGNEDYFYKELKRTSKELYQNKLEYIKESNEYLENPLHIPSSQKEPRIFPDYPY